MLRSAQIIALLLIAASSLQSCKFLLGQKEDETVDEIFREGRIDPKLVPNTVGYVPIFPFFDGFLNPIDVFFGYDEMIYVVDDLGVHVLDQTGRKKRLIPIPGAKEVCQDRRLHTYVAGRVDVSINGTVYNLAAVYHLSNTAGAGAVNYLDTLYQPAMDGTRSNFKPASDPQVEINGITVLHDNTLLVGRTGPVNDLTSFNIPDNAVLFFSADGKYMGYAKGLNPVGSSLKSVKGIAGMACFAAPPQRLNSMPTSKDFLLVLNDPDPNFEFKALWIKEYPDPDLGSEYGENTSLLNFDTARASRFFYESFRFQRPTDIFAAADQSNYFFVTDAATDMVYQFTQRGFEGVNPPPNSGISKQVIASFGGEGNGPFNFRDPSGVCFARGYLFVADKGNNRICRYKLSTDLE